MGAGKMGWGQCALSQLSEGDGLRRKCQSCVLTFSYIPFEWLHPAPSHPQQLWGGLLSAVTSNPRQRKLLFLCGWGAVLMHNLLSSQPPLPLHTQHPQWKGKEGLRMSQSTDHLE